MPTMWLADTFQWPAWATSCCLVLLVCLLSLHVIEKLLGLQRSSQTLGNAQPKATDDEAFAHFQRQYLVVYGLVMLADWLQGTHIPVSQLLPVLMVVLICRSGFADRLLGKTFAFGSEINGVVAVIAGLVAQITADAFGDVGPFRAAVVVTVIAAAFVFSWSENYGSPTEDDRRRSKRRTIRKTVEKQATPVCSWILFLWYPTLEAVVPRGELPSGLVFSSFMLCIATGGKLFDLVGNSWVREELLLLVTAAVSAVSLLIPTVRFGEVVNGISFEQTDKQCCSGG
ncbi:Major facilitator superfamily domain [Phytophthora cactorum]|nr:Major facilitator superfamily domain [Phytophthora cactorum]